MNTEKGTSGVRLVFTLSNKQMIVDLSVGGVMQNRYAIWAMLEKVD
jgi:hypothetical protein